MRAAFIKAAQCSPSQHEWTHLATAAIPRLSVPQGDTAHVCLLPTLTARGRRWSFDIGHGVVECPNADRQRDPFLFEPQAASPAVAWREARTAVLGIQAETARQSAILQSLSNHIARPSEWLPLLTRADLDPGKNIGP